MLEPFLLSDISKPARRLYLNRGFLDGGKAPGYADLGQIKGGKENGNSQAR